MNGRVSVLVRSYGAAGTSTDFPWEPPFAGTELERLVGALDRLRTTFRRKADGLDATGLRIRVGASELTLGGLLKHLAFVEDFTFTVKLAGTSPGQPWETADWDAVGNWDFVPAVEDTPEELYAPLGGSGRTVSRPPRRGPGRGWARSARRPLLGRRTPSQLAPTGLRPGRGVGQARRARRPAARGADGLVGEDPPAGWRASTGWLPSSR